MKSNRTKKANN